MEKLNQSQLKLINGGSEIGYFIGYHLRKFVDAITNPGDSKEIQFVQNTNAVSIWN